MTLGIIIQARSGSKRLPSKIFLTIDKKTILERVISQVKKLKIKKKIIIATTKNKKDYAIVNLAKNNSCQYFRGSSSNVLKRYYDTAKKFNIKTIVRICSDSPFIDPKIIEKCIKIFKSKKYDYVSNIIKPSYPVGMSCEVISLNALTKAYFAETDYTEKEHVTPYIYRNPKKFRNKNIRIKKDLSNYRLAVDYIEDYSAAIEIFKKIKNKKNYNYKDLVNILAKYKSIRKINLNKKTTLRY